MLGICRWLHSAVHSRRAPQNAEVAMTYNNVITASIRNVFYLIVVTENAALVYQSQYPPKLGDTNTVQGLRRNEGCADPNRKYDGPAPDLQNLPLYPVAVIFSGPLPIAMRDFCSIFLGVTISCLIAKINRPHCPFNRSTAQWGRCQHFLFIYYCSTFYLDSSTTVSTLAVRGNRSTAAARTAR